MTADQYLEIGKTLGVPAAVAGVFLFMGMAVLFAAIKGVKWVGERLFGDTGIATRLLERHVEFMDAVEKSDEKHTENLVALTESTRAIDSCLAKLADVKLEAIHSDVKHGNRLAERLIKKHDC